MNSPKNNMGSAAPDQSWEGLGTETERPKVLTSLANLSQCETVLDPANFNSAEAGDSEPPPSSRPSEDSSRVTLATQADLDKMLHAHDKNPLLNYENMVRACDEIFGHRKTITLEEYHELVKNAYKINMEEYARKHNFTDGVKLVEFFAKVQSALPKDKSGRIVIVGCGQGRLIEVFVSLADRFGVKEIILNDLVPEHLEKTREKIKRLYNSETNASGVAVSYVEGDIMSADIPDGIADAAYLLWYVGAEFCDPSSPENMDKIRVDTYRKISNILIPGGAMVEDMPNQNMRPGLYHYGVMKTRHILNQRGLMQNRDGSLTKNLLLTHWGFEQSDGGAQIRYLPHNGKDAKQKWDAGQFHLAMTDDSSIPEMSMHKSADTVVSILKDMDNFELALTELNRMVGATVNFPPVIEPARPNVSKRKNPQIWKEYESQLRSFEEQRRRVIKLWLKSA